MGTPIRTHVQCLLLFLVGCCDEGLDGLLGRVDDPRVVAEVEHAENGAQDGHHQPTCHPHACEIVFFFQYLDRLE